MHLLISLVPKNDKSIWGGFKGKFYLSQNFKKYLFLSFLYRPLPPAELKKIIYQACGGDSSTAVLTQVPENISFDLVSIL